MGVVKNLLIENGIVVIGKHKLQRFKYNGNLEQERDRNFYEDNIEKYMGGSLYN